MYVSVTILQWELNSCPTIIHKKKIHMETPSYRKSCGGRHGDKKADA